MKAIAIIITILSTLSLSARSQAQIGTTETITIAMSVLSGIAVLAIIYIASSFLLRLVRLFLKKALIEKGVSRELVMELRTSENDQKGLALKWFCLLIAAGLGLSVAYFFQPFGWHSVIILTFSLAAGFLAWYLLLSRT